MADMMNNARALFAIIMLAGCIFFAFAEAGEFDLPKALQYKLKVNGKLFVKDPSPAVIKAALGKPIAAVELSPCSREINGADAKTYSFGKSLSDSNALISIFEMSSSETRWETLDVSAGVFELVLPSIALGAKTTPQAVRKAIPKKWRPEEQSDSNELRLLITDQADGNIRPGYWLTFRRNRLASIEYWQFC